MCNPVKISSLLFMLTYGLGETVTIAGEESAPASTTHAPAGFVLIEENQWSLMAEEPNHYFGRAREAFLMVDSETAAEELRKASVHLRIAASSGAEQTKRGLIRSEHELEQTARRIEAGTIKSVDELDLATARAMHRLSEYQHHKAAEAWHRKDARQAGHYLRAAANNIEHAAARTEAKMKTAASEVARESRAISSSMITGTGYVAEEVAAGFDAVGHQIERVGARISPTLTR